MGFKTIEICEAERLKLYLNNVIIYKNESKFMLPISSIDTLIIDNNRTNISIQLINKLSENNVLIIICDKRHLPISQIIPISGHYNSLKILENQVKWTNKQKGEIWQKIIKAKISNQIGLLNYLNINSNELNLLMNDVEIFDITNREGHASKIYWHKLFGIHFNREDEDNEINSCLNYGYAILLGYLSRSIIKKGLDNRIAIFHKSFSNHFALACDLMEMFRPMIDYLIYMFYNKKKPFTLSEIKDDILKLFTKKIKLNGLYEFFNNAIDKTIDILIQNWSIPEIIIEYDKF